MKTVAQTLASLCQARLNCIERNNTEWRANHEYTILRVVKNCLPSGSGIDSGCTIDLDRSNSDKLVLHTAFHHMNDNGMYDGWTQHTITVKPSFDGVSIATSGRNRNDIKEYLREVFHNALTCDIAGRDK